MADGGNFLTNKVGPFPGYVWVLGGGAALLLWRSRSASSTGSSSSQTAAQQAQLAATEQEMASAAYPTYEQSGAGGQPVYVLPTGGSDVNPAGGDSTGTSTGVPAPTAPAIPNATYSGDLQANNMGGGYFYGSSNTQAATTPVYGVGGPSAGVFEELTSPGQEAGVPAGSIYYSPVPGVFDPYTPGLKNAPAFLKVG